ncbi:DinB family protein [Emticicia oligotrophica DSM 17448]|uniref:DinB family protein n=1 Tax=Emticicia oligotrophica (strain DSM 17448 / CIP 109782 / MTCC 6937 / GPTSA100-15) TaxID=929562 RepID=A0ABM5N075_EMTOG|nr:MULTISPECIES: DinB family protein [Emticicia]AFK02838.1 DinB family protein [Emticicia oligotrophica DSM 17448]
MSLIAMYLQELEQESATTRKFLSIVPDDKLDWQPHPKSMTIRQLATHIAELPTWITYGITTDELDFAQTPYEPKVINNRAELLAYFEECFADGRSVLVPENESKLSESWVLRAGDQIYMDITKAETIRNALSQTIHHRAQLGVFLRLLDIPIPGSYGPSADELS